MPLASPPPNALTPPGPYPSLPASHARLSTRQTALAFNQLLSFNTSKVTRMSSMFYVRSARALAPTALSRALPVHATCVAATQRPQASRAGTSSRTAFPPFDSAASVGVQPAAQLRHVQGHEHVRHV
eukprot:scaffold110757_cov63-Phaeocystis_antarctica.AAC.3